jgi:hypothetical protein
MNRLIFTQRMRAIKSNNHSGGFTMAKNIYAVEVTVNGSSEISRFFTKIANARNWKKWLETEAWCNNVRILKGGQGGIEIK